MDSSGLAATIPWEPAIPMSIPSAAATVWALPLALAGDTRDQKPYYYVTYTRFNAATGKTYCGRSSGYGDPDDIVKRRGWQQKQLNAEGFSDPKLDKYSPEPDSIRGREQQLIDYNGGAQSVGGTTRNAINGVGDFNIRGAIYDAASTANFGALPDNSPPRFRVWK
jgi:hypothetical protein